MAGRGGIPSGPAGGGRKTRLRRGDLAPVPLTRAAGERGPRENAADKTRLAQRRLIWEIRKP